MKYGIWFIFYLLAFLISLNPIFSFSCINASLLTTLTNPYSCYYIKNVKNKIYNCTSRLTNSSVYDLIVINSKNLIINCSFEKALIYNSTNIIIKNSDFVDEVKDEIILWNSSVVLQKNRFIGKVGGMQIEDSTICEHHISGDTSFIICYPPSLSIRFVTEDFPKGVLGRIFLYVTATNETLHDVWISITPSCYAEIWVLNSSKHIIGSGNKILIPEIKKGETVSIDYLVRIIDGKNCTFFVSAYSDITKDREYTESSVNILSNESVIYGKNRIIASEYITLIPFLITLAILTFI